MPDTAAISEWARANGAWLLPLAWTFSALAVASALAAVAPDRAAAPPAAGESFAAKLLRWNRRPLVFGAILLAAVLLHRFPTVVGPTMQNPDEAQLVAGAITLGHAPIYWKSVDGNTTGPLNIVVLTWPWLLGQVPTLATSRLTGLLLMFAGLWFTGRALRRLTDEGTARVGLLPGFAWLAFVSYWDFVQYSSEQLSVALLGHAAWRLVRAHQSPAKTGFAAWRPWLAAGASLGVLSLAKLQSAPAAAALLAVTLYARWRAEPRPSIFARCALGLGAGGALVAAALGLYLAIWGLGAQFKLSYIDCNLVYTGSSRMALPDLVRRMLGIVDHVSGFPTYLVAAVGAGVVGAALTATAGGRARRGFAAGAIVVWLGGIASTLGPGRDFGHYLQFVFVPTAVFAAAGLAVLDATLAARGARPAVRTGAFAVFAVATLTPQLVRMVRYPSWYRYNMPAQSWQDPRPAGEAIAALTRPDESIAVWGWMPGFYVVAQRPQGVREAVTERQIHQGPLQGAYRTRFLFDLRRNRPAAFVDATGGNNFIYNEGFASWSRHENWPELRDFVAENYVLAREVAASRIYLRRDLAGRAEGK